MADFDAMHTDGHTTATLQAAGSPASFHLDSLRALERSRARWRLLAVALCGCGVGAVAAGAGQAASRRPLQAIALDDSRGSGRWNSTLLAVDDSGKVYFLNTTKPQSAWEPFQYSP